jgi:hypothetical protein
VAGFTWTGWQLSRGLSGNLPMDWVAGIRGIRTQGGGAFYNVTFAKHYKDGDEWKTSQSFGMGELLELSKVADHAHTGFPIALEK